MRIGSLFSGYGGLDMGVQAAIGGEVVWHSEIDEAPSRILTHHYPEVPNHGDITKVDWSRVEPVDVLTGGFPCQDVSLAGRRAGITAGTRSGLWSEFAHAIEKLRPGLVVIENVRGLLSATADGPMESDPWGVGDGATRPVVNALGVVLGDLASLGYDTVRGGVRASDAGAPHGRFRVFVIAYPSGDGRGGHTELHREPVEPELEASQREHSDRYFPADPAGVAGGIGDRDNVRTRRGAVGRAQDAGAGFAQDTDVAAGGERRVTASEQAEGGRSRADAGRRGGTPAADAAGDGWREGRSESAGIEGRPDDELGSASPGAWRQYEPAIRRWEHATGRVAPAPTNADGKGNSHRLSSAFVEWMMGLPAGHVTDPAIGLTRNQQLKALGNGVVPQQAELAVRTLLEVA